MSDLRTMMTEAAGAAPVTDDRIADADLYRARQARRRRRIGRIGSSSGLIAVAAVGALAIAGPSLLSGSSEAPAPVASGPATTNGVATVSGTALVSYTGKQPVGYTLDKVPAGWKVIHVDAGALTLAPEDFVLPEGAVPGEIPPAGSDREAVSWEGMIVVMQSDAASVPRDVPMDKVTVGGFPGFIAQMKDGDGGVGARTLFAEQPSGAYLTIQVWKGLGWNNDQIVEFGSGVHVTKAATVGVG